MKDTDDHVSARDIAIAAGVIRVEEMRSATRDKFIALGFDEDDLTVLGLGRYV